MILLTEQEKSVILKHREILANMFNRRSNELIEQVINMEPGPDRDAAILLAREFRIWKADILKLQVGEPNTKEPLI